MEISEKEKEFEKAYKDFVAKWNVKPVIVTYFDDDGDQFELHFKEAGKYCNIDYQADCDIQDDGRCCMGG